MTARGWGHLAIATVTDPAGAAGAILALRLPSAALWSALALAAVLNTLMFSASARLFPAPPFMPPFLEVPFAYLGLVALGLVAFILCLTLGGRLFGGTGTLAEVMAVMVWLQYLRLAVQAVALALAVIVPMASMILVVAASAVGLYILLHFIAAAHRFGSILRAAGVVIVALLAMSLALSVLVTLLVASSQGISAHV